MNGRHWVKVLDRWRNDRTAQSQKGPVYRAGTIRAGHVHSRAADPIREGRAGGGEGAGVSLAPAVP
jgi:hypothetical protein